MNQFTKAVTRPVSTRQEVHTLTQIDGDDLTFTLCDRTDLSDKRSNYFVSFNLPHESDAFVTGNTVSLQRPELQQLNVDRIVICDIPASAYSEYIDGRSISFTVPQVSGGTEISAKTIVSSTYSNLEKKQEDILLGTNVSFLFSDDINLPYTGTVANTSVTRANVNTWNVTSSVVNKPVATSYNDLQINDINSDQRPFSGVNLAVPINQSYPNNTNQGYNYDIPVGFVSLDKGFLILTHPDIVENIPWNQGFKKTLDTVNTGPTSATTDIYFTSTTTSVASFIDVNIEFKTSVACLIMPGEFYKTTNPTWDARKGLQEEQNGTFGMDPVYISEIALHNSKGDVIAFAKLDRPISKSYGDFLSFNVDLTI